MNKNKESILNLIKMVMIEKYIYYNLQNILN